LIQRRTSQGLPHVVTWQPTGGEPTACRPSRAAWRRWRSPGRR
jgi:hypothetical protein